MPITIRVATAADSVPIAALIAELIASHGYAVPPHDDLLAATRHVIATPGMEFIVAEVEGAIVGCLQLSERFSTWHNAPFGYIDDFVVSGDWRGQGVGAILLVEVRRLAAERGYCRVDLDVARENRAVGFYAREGFHDSGTFLFRLETRNGERGTRD